MEIGLCFVLRLMLCFSTLDRGLGADTGSAKYEVQGDARYENGQRQVSEIRKYSENPRYGKCWTDALAMVMQGCKRLTDDEQSRMALALTNCHLEKASFPVYECEEGMSLAKCLSQMRDDSKAFNAYTVFFTHTQNICFFLQNQVWHEQTEQTVTRLSESSVQVAERLEESMENQKDILENERMLRDALKSSADSVKEIFEEMKSSTSQQKILFEETFERVSSVQKLILGEFTWLHSLVFYIAAIVIAYMLTSTQRTGGARLWLFLVCGLNMAAERALFVQYQDSDQTFLYEQMWNCRKLFSGVAVLVLAICAYRYQDYSVMNNKILRELQAQMYQVQEKMQTPAQPPLRFERRPKHYLRDEPDAKVTSFIGSNSICLHGSSSEELTSSDPDQTFVPEGGNSSDSDAESFTTAEPGSRRPSQTTANLVSSFRGSASFVDGPSQPTNSGIKGKGRPKGSRSRTSRETTPSMNTSYQSPYNLRRRTSPTVPNNSILQAETVEMFLKEVRRNQQVYSIGPRSNQTPNTVPMKKGRPKKQEKSSFFSSDEDI